MNHIIKKTNTYSFGFCTFLMSFNVLITNICFGREKKEKIFLLPKTNYRKIASSKTSRLEAHVGIFRL